MAQRATDQAVVADDFKKAYWKARKELNKTAASCASASVGERESVRGSLLRTTMCFAEAPPPPLVSQVQSGTRNRQTWSSDAIDMFVRLCTEHRNQEEALRGSLG